jgi:hypothetical protein
VPGGRQPPPDPPWPLLPPLPGDAAVRAPRKPPPLFVLLVSTYLRAAEPTPAAEPALAVTLAVALDADPADAVLLPLLRPGLSTLALAPVEPEVAGGDAEEPAAGLPGGAAAVSSTGAGGGGGAAAAAAVGAPAAGSGGAAAGAEAAATKGGGTACAIAFVSVQSAIRVRREP